MNIPTLGSSPAAAPSPPAAEPMRAPMHDPVRHKGGSPWESVLAAANDGPPMSRREESGTTTDNAAVDADSATADQGGLQQTTAPGQPETAAIRADAMPPDSTPVYLPWAATTAASASGQAPVATATIIAGVTANREQPSVTGLGAQAAQLSGQTVASAQANLVPTSLTPIQSQPQSAIQRFQASLEAQPFSGLMTTTTGKLALLMGNDPIPSTTLDTPLTATAGNPIPGFTATVSLPSNTAPLPGVQTVALPVSHPDWQIALAERVLISAQHETPQVQLQLNPIELGPVDVRIEVNHERASVHFAAAHAATREALEQALPRLRELFAQQGLQLTDSGVQQHFQTPSHSRHAPQGSLAEQAGMTGLSDPPRPTTPPPPTFRHGYRLSLYA